MIDISRCSQCSMNSQRKIQVDTVGSGPCELLLVGLHPMTEDGNAHAPYTGNRYNYIWELLTSTGISFYVTTLFKCVAGRDTTSDLCLETFKQEVAYLAPKCILFLGEDALKKAVSEDAKMTEYREYAHTSSLYGNSKLLATYDPRVVFPDNEIVYNRFIDDLVYATRHAAAYRTSGLYRSLTITPDQFHRIVDVWLGDPSIKYVSFDSESNGLDPLLEGLKITSFSVSVDGKIGYNIFLYHPDLLIEDSIRDQIIQDAKRLLTCKDIVVHHAKHEHRLIKVLWGFTPNITDDTMYMSYILYLSYPGISHGLKFLSGRFVNLPPWEEVLYRFVTMFKKLSRLKTLNLQTVGEIIDSLSDVYQLTIEDIQRFYQIVQDPTYPLKAKQCEMNTDPYYWLVPAPLMETYAGMDAIAPLLLMAKFKPVIDGDSGLVRAYNLMVKGAEAFANIELHGVRLIGLDNWSQRYDVKLDECLKLLRSFPEIEVWESENPLNKFNPSSAKILGTILYERMKFPVVEYTQKGAPSTAEPAMIEMIKKFRESAKTEEELRRLEFLEVLRDYKKLAKIKSAYWEGLKDYIHEKGSFDGHTCTYYPLEGDVESMGRCDIINPGYMLHGTDCVVAGTKVPTSQGLMNIEDLAAVKDFSEGKGFYPIKEGIKVYDGTDWREPLSFYYGGKRGVLEVSTEDCTHIRCTPEHPLMTREGWKPAEELTFRDFLLIYRYDEEKGCVVQCNDSGIEDVKFAGFKEVYDLSMDTPDD